MDILIRVYESDRCDSYYSIPKQQPHPLAVQKTYEKIEVSHKTEVTKLIAKLDDEGKPYIGSEIFLEYPKDWFKKGRDHQENENDIRRTVDVDIWVVTVNTLEELDQLMGDLDGSLSQQNEYGTVYTLEAYESL